MQSLNAVHRFAVASILITALSLYGCGGGGSGSEAPTSTPPTFTTQPTNQSVTVPDSATFSVVATGTPSPTLQWQVSTNAGTNWDNINGAIADSYTTPATVLGDSGKQFRAAATNIAGTTFSSSATLTVTSIVTPPTAVLTPAAGTIIETGMLKVVFSKSMNVSSMTATMGATGLSGTWSNTTYTNDTVSFSGTYPVGTQTFTLNATDLTGNPLATLSGIFDVVPAFIYVSTSGNDGNPGTTALPKLTIAAALNQAVAGQTVAVAQGNYIVYNTLGTIVVPKDGVALYGGYASDFSSRDPTRTNHVTTITNYSSGDSATISAGGTIGTDTVVDGFVIKGADSGNGRAIFIYNGAKPLIRNNTILGGNNVLDSVAVDINSANPTIAQNIITAGYSTQSYGILNDAASPYIYRNIIRGGTATNHSIGIINFGAASLPVITNNLIIGGSGNVRSSGMWNLTSSNPTVANNTILGGTSPDVSVGIDSLDASGSYINNILSATAGATARVCYFENDANSDPVKFSNNALYNCQALYLDEGTVAIVAIANVNTLVLRDGSTVATNNVATDPLFMNAAGGDYHLQATSPIRALGLDLSSIISDDMDGNLRTVPYSIGAYEKD